MEPIIAKIVNIEILGNPIVLYSANLVMYII